MEYIRAELEVTEFNVEDVITTSSGIGHDFIIEENQFKYRLLMFDINYVRADLEIIEFYVEDIVTTSSVDSDKGINLDLQ